MTIMAKSRLNDAIQAVDWNVNVGEFAADVATVQRFERCSERIAVWSRQLESADRGNPALSFVREMQVAGHSVPALAALALYKPSAAAMRTVCETALYYTFFRTHHAEMATLIRDRSYFVTKNELIEYHRLHTERFKEIQEKLGLLTRLDEWYSKMSAVIHGQIPGEWSAHPALKDTAHKEGMREIVAEAFEQCEGIVHCLFLCTVGQELWHDFASAAKRSLLKGLTGDVKAVLGLDPL